MSYVHTDTFPTVVRSRSEPIWWFMLTTVMHGQKEIEMMGVSQKRISKIWKRVHGINGKYGFFSRFAAS